eukprot:TRINITY_DN557_c6_g1_i1.p1 TRINITY_DN557_c6_g1~~TRINITY_DN557_c6_g1_i1.p1  ORF type:complete len:221 (-),score=46.11 TRINITY_DN557_c6_g1_i1:78-740(-)
MKIGRAVGSIVKKKGSSRLMLNDEKILIDDKILKEEGGRLKRRSVSEEEVGEERKEEIWLPEEIMLKIVGEMRPRGKYVKCLRIKERRCRVRTAKVVKKLSRFLGCSLKLRLVCRRWKKLAEDWSIWLTYYSLRWPKEVNIIHSLPSTTWRIYLSRSIREHQDNERTRVEDAKRMKALKKQEVTLRIVGAPLICANFVLNSVFYDSKKTPTYVASPCIYL